MSPRVRSSSPRAWAVVTLVGFIVLAVVVGLQLFPRLGDGQDVVDGLAPANTEARVATARGGVDIVSSIVDLADPIVLESGGAAAEVPALVTFVATQTGLSEAAVLEALGTNFPHVLGLLKAIPLEAVRAEVPGLVTFLATTLDTTEGAVLATLTRDFPRLTQAVGQLQFVTDGWGDVPDTPGPRFDGSDITTAGDVRTYFRDDVVPVFERQNANLRNVDDLPGGVGFLAPLLLAVAVVVIVFGLLMMLLSRGGGAPRPLAITGWVVVIIVGLVVELVVFGFQLFPRLDDAQTLLDDAKPAFTADRVDTAVGGITIVSHVVDTADPLVLESGGAAAEVPRLVTLVAEASGLAPDAVLATLGESFPHVLGLLQALPLEQVNAEIPALVTFLSTNLGLTEDEVGAALAESFPRLSQSITALPIVVAGWGDVPNTPGDRFDGTEIKTVPDVRDYFRDDVIAVVSEQREAFDNLESTWPPTNFFPPLLTVVGLLVIVYGVVMLRLAMKAGSTSSHGGAQHPGGTDWSAGGGGPRHAKGAPGGKPFDVVTGGTRSGQFDVVTGGRPRRPLRADP